MGELGLDLHEAFHHLELSILSAERTYQLKAWPLPAPLHLLGAILSSRGFSLGDRYLLIRFNLQLQRRRWQVEPQQTVLGLLKQYHQSETLIEHLWQPLCLAALNTPLDLACAQLFANVLRDSLGAGRQSSQMLIPKRDMSSLWLEPALKHVDLRLGQRVHTLRLDDERVIVNDQIFDACIIATPPYASAKLLRTLITPEPLAETWIAGMEAVQYRPIATVYLEPENPWAEMQPLLMLHENREQHEFGQWLFNHHAMPDSFARSLIAVVISDAVALNDLSRTEVIAAVEAQIRRQTTSRAPLPTIVRSELIIEKRATFEASPFSFRATEQTPWPNIYLAGDWLKNDYPGVLEGAVRSGLTSAALVHKKCLSQHAR